MTTATVTRTPMLTAALAAARRGWHVFPLKPGAKTPAVTRWEERATTDPARIERCWSAGPFGVGIACGPSRLVVVDLDQPKPDFVWPAEWSMVGVFDGGDVFTIVAERAEQPVPLDTYTVGTASGGTHLYYQAPDGANLRNTAGSKGCGLGPLIDTRARGGYVVAAGTTLADGRTYTTVYGREPALLPGWLVTALTPPPPPLPAAPVKLSSDRVARYVDTAVNGAVEHIHAADKAGDGRKHAVFHAAITLGRLVAGGSLAETDAHRDLHTAGLAVGLTVGVVRSAIRSGFRYGAQKPRVVTA